MLLSLDAYPIVQINKLSLLTNNNLEYEGRKMRFFVIKAYSPLTDSGINPAIV